MEAETFDGALLSNVERAEVRKESTKQIHSMAEQPYRLMGVLVLAGAVALIVSGAYALGKAETARLYGWETSTCSIVRGNWSSTHTTATNVCIYFSVTHHVEEPPLCAVPARLATAGDLVTPPACGDALTAEEMADVTYWRTLSHADAVECLVPVDQPGIPPERCMLAATSAGPGAALWRAWQVRFVYLLRSEKDGASVLHEATRLQRNSGVSMVAFGTILLLLAFVFICRPCVGRCSRAAVAYETPMSKVIRERTARDTKTN